ncbi:ATP-dependent helicase Fun30p [Monosporozyma servazzii]
MSDQEYRDDDDVQVPATSSPTKVISSSSPLKDDANASLRSRFSFKPTVKQDLGTTPSLPSTNRITTSNTSDMDTTLDTLSEEYPEFSRTLVQAVFKSNSFDINLSKARLDRIKQQRRTWSGATKLPTSNMSSDNKLNNNEVTRRFNSLNSESSTKITLNKPKTSIFDRYSNVINTKKEDISFIPTFNSGSRKRKLVRGDQMSKRPHSKPTELDNTKNKILKAKAQRLMDKESDDETEEEGSNNDEMVSEDDDEGADYEEASVQPLDLDDQILRFLNTADPLDIADLADTTFDKAQIVISKRPFNSIVLFSDMDFFTEEELKKQQELENSPSPSPISGKGRGRGRRGTPRPRSHDGEKFLEKLGEAIKGYNAIESLLKKCSSYGNMISGQISKWGVDMEKGSGADAKHEEEEEEEEEAGLQLMTVDDDDDDISPAVVDGFDETESTSIEEVKDENKGFKSEELNDTKMEEQDNVKKEEREDIKAENRDEEVFNPENEDAAEEEDDEEDEYMEDFEQDDDDDDDDEDEEFVMKKRTFEGTDRSRNGKQIIKFFRGKPRLLAQDMQLKDYQQMGVNWLNLLYHNGMSCILADDMGLGKTCQVISFLAYLKQIKEPGPHLIVVPSSTLENWLREFKKFCPALKIEPYYGSQQERAELREMLENAHGQYDVIVTTYNLAAGNKYDVSFLRNRGFNVVVYDEGHMLKNSLSERFNKLMKIRGNFRLLLTGTPLQNNLRELMSLLEFIMPQLFIAKKESLTSIFKQKAKTTDDNKGHNPLLVQNAIERARTMMRPFILRRRKDQVLKHLPAKHNKIVTCEMNEIQRKIYNAEIKQVMERRKARLEAEQEEKESGKKKSKKKVDNSSKNLIMSLRKVSIHPLLFRNIYTDAMLDKMSKAILKEPAYAAEGNKQYIMEDMSVMTDYELHNLCCTFPNTLKRYQLCNNEWMNSGKVTKLVEILKDVIEVKKEKLLVFSLFTQVLDILELVLSTLGYKFLRLDGSTQVNERQGLIDTFYEDKTIPIFILSTKAGGFGINLVCANHVVIFDQSFNPHDDRQAADRAHRVGQTREVTISTLITKDSIEEKIHQLAKNKLALDNSISGEDKKSQDAMESKISDLLEDIIYQEHEKEAEAGPEATPQTA